MLAEYHTTSEGGLEQRAEVKVGSIGKWKAGSYNGRSAAHGSLARFSTSQKACLMDCVYRAAGAPASKPSRASAWEELRGILDSNPELVMACHGVHAPRRSQALDSRSKFGNSQLLESPNMEREWVRCNHASPDRALTMLRSGFVSRNWSIASHAAQRTAVFLTAATWTA